MGPSGERCGLCYFCVDPGALDEYTGICRRYPREPTSHRHDNTQATWVSAGDWCGEFKLHPDMSSHLSRFRPVKWYDDHRHQPKTD